jgi:pyrroloquinoline quinone biosynthesis protein E
MQIESLSFDNVRHRPLEWIWRASESFAAFRGDGWMVEPCRSCPRKSIDFGGCRCQAFKITGDARSADPVCEKSPARAIVDGVLASVPSTGEEPEYKYRVMTRARAARLPRTAVSG